MLAAPGRRSWAVTSLAPSAGLSAPDILRAMRGRGFTLANGLGELAGQIIRIGHMGDLTPTHLESMLAELGAVTGS